MFQIAFLLLLGALSSCTCLLFCSLLTYLLCLLLLYKLGIDLCLVVCLQVMPALCSAARVWSHVMLCVSVSGFGTVLVVKANSFCTTMCDPIMRLPSFIVIQNACMSFISAHTHKCTHTCVSMNVCMPMNCYLLLHMWCTTPVSPTHSISSLSRRIVVPVTIVVPDSVTIDLTSVCRHPASYIHISPILFRSISGQ